VGIDYSYQVYVHRRDAGRLLTAVAAMCDRSADEWTTVILPDGTSMVLPGLYGFKTGRVVDLAEVVEGRDRSDFGLSLCFPQDGPLGEYQDAKTHPADLARPWPDGTTRVGLIYLMVFDGSALLPEHWIFDFTPAATVQSRLFLSSPSIRQTFATFTLAVEGPLCLLDVEERFDVVVTARDRQVATQVPGPCLLWDKAAPKDEAYRELLARLAGQPPATTPRWIVGPGHPDYDAFLESLTRNSQVTGAIC
jgi:hypothetical protein